MEKSIIRIYKKEEMEAMNYILGKYKDNKTFTKFELEAMKLKGMVVFQMHHKKF